MASESKSILASSDAETLKQMQSMKAVSDYFYSEGIADYQLGKASLQEILIAFFTRMHSFVDGITSLNTESMDKETLVKLKKYKLYSNIASRLSPLYDLLINNQSSHELQMFACEIMFCPPKDKNIKKGSHYDRRHFVTYPTAAKAAIPLKGVYERDMIKTIMNRMEWGINFLFRDFMVDGEPDLNLGTLDESKIDFSQVKFNFKKLAEEKRSWPGIGDFAKTLLKMYQSFKNDDIVAEIFALCKQAYQTVSPHVKAVVKSPARHRPERPEFSFKSIPMNDLSHVKVSVQPSDEHTPVRRHSSRVIDADKATVSSPSVSSSSMALHSDTS